MKLRICFFRHPGLGRGPVLLLEPLDSGPGSGAKMTFFRRNDGGGETL